MFADIELTLQEGLQVYIVSFGGCRPRDRHHVLHCDAQVVVGWGPALALVAGGVVLVTVLGELVLFSRASCLLLGNTVHHVD